MPSKSKKTKEQLLDKESHEKGGISNLGVDEEVEMSGMTEVLSDASSAEIVDETLDAELLVKDLKTKRYKKQRELSKEVQSPKDDLSHELKEVKRRSKQKIEESERLEKNLPSADELVEHGISQDSHADEDTIDAGPSEPSVMFQEEEPRQEEKSHIKKLVKKKGAVEATDVAEIQTPTARSPETEDETAAQKTPRGLSLREKMKNRLQKAKAEAVTEMREEAREERKEKRLKDLKEKKDTRFDTGMDEAELERYTEEKASKLRQRWKKAGQTLQEKTGVYIPTADESFDFFTRVWESEAESESQIDETKEKIEDEKPGPSHEQDKEKETEQEEKEDEGAERSGVFEGYGFIVLRKAEYIDPEELVEKEAKILFYPSNTAIPPEQKIFEEELQPRFLEEEGFYVGTQPTIATSNKNKMEHRLIRQIEFIKEEKKNKMEEEQVRKWFGEDGCLIALPDPLRLMPSRPPVEEEPEELLETVYRKAVLLEHDNRYIDGAAQGTGNYQLCVDINSIVFTHHHHYSREHVLATRLNELYDQYILRKKKNMENYLTEKLKALKSSALHLQDYIISHKSEHTPADRDNYRKRMDDYKSEIRETHIMRDREELANRTLLKNIINVWKEIKNRREFQKFTNTPVKLKIVKEEVDKAYDQLLWKQEIEGELEELRDEHELEYVKKITVYQEQMAKWQEQQEAKKAAQARQKKRKKNKKNKRSGSRQSLEPGQEEQMEADDELDQQILNEEDLLKPDPPETFDEKSAKEKIKSKAMEIRRRPGEPKLHLELTNTATITPSHQCTQRELQRREAVSRCKIFIRVLFNNKEVYRTAAKPLSQDFRVSFAQIYNLKIIQWPESIKFQVHEVIGLSTQLLAEFCAAIPEVSVTSQTVQIEELEFSSDHRVQHSHEGVGSGVPFIFGSKGTELFILMTTGLLSYSVAWAVDDDGLPLVPPGDTTNAPNMFDAMKKMDPLAAVGAAGLNDIQELQKWFENSKLDPNDPSNADLVYLLRPRGGNQILQPVDYFRLEQLQEEFNLCIDDEIVNNKRFQLLEYRDQEIQEFRNVKMVPALEREVPRDTFTDYEKKKREEEKLRHSEDIESHRAAVARYMQRTREQVMRRFRILTQQKKLDDMVREDEVPNVAMIGTSLLRLTQRRRPLKPERKERKKMATQVIKGDEAKIQILVNIVRALYIPIRSAPPAVTGGTTARGGETEKKGVRSLVGDTLVRPFIEMVFQHNTVRTSISDGPNPSFNEELEIPFRAPNDDYSPRNLQTVSDIIFLNLFDEVVVDILEDEQQRDTNIHQRVEKKWLGSLKIPFSTVYFNGKIEGTFRVDVPPILLGYTYGQDLADTEMGIGKEGNTYLSLFITIDPPLILAEPVKDKFSTNEDEKLMQYAEKWQADLEKKFPKRSYKTTVIDVNGKSVFITRYFKALKPPEELLSGGGSAEVTSELVARYVSMIPFVSDSVVFPGLCDIWSTCDQFLKMLAGDEEEHAVLLTNFFLAMNKKTWLVVGSAIPEGPTAYVMTMEGTDSDCWIWNAGTGQHFSYQDNYCPLQTISCLINNENIWANIQQYEKPAQMLFDLSNTSHWVPCFNGHFTNPKLGSIQPETLYYFTTDKTYVADLQEKIEQTLKNKIMEWRSRFITRWNRHCTQIMRRLLPVLEENRGKSVDQQHLQELEQTFGSYKVTGFPLNMPFVELNSVVEAVYATGVHAQESSSVEYALAVYIEPYPNSVLSVWVYVASLIRIR